MSTRLDVVHAFFQAENARDWKAYARFLHPDVEWTLVDEAGTRVIRGSHDYVAAITAAYEGSPITFRTVDTLVSENDAKVAVLLVDDVGQRSLDVLEWEGDVLRREWEFLLGAGPAWTRA